MIRLICNQLKCVILIAAIKNAIDQVYATFLPKGNHPFVYMDLQIEAKNVDVNMHPTKHEVNFLYENEIIDQIRAAFEVKLVGSNDTRELYTQQLLPGASNPIGDDEQETKGKEAKVYAKDIIRSDSKEQKLEKFFGTSFRKESPFDQSQIASDEQESQSDTEPVNTSKNTSLNTSLRKSLILPTRTNADAERKYADDRNSFTKFVPSNQSFCR